MIDKTIIESLREQALGIRDERRFAANTAIRVGTMFVDIIDALGIIENAGRGVSSWLELTDKPSTIAGFGIEDAYTKSQIDHTFVPRTVLEDMFTKVPVETHIDENGDTVVDSWVIRANYTLHSVGDVVAFSREAEGSGDRPAGVSYFAELGEVRDAGGPTAERPYWGWVPSSAGGTGGHYGWIAGDGSGSGTVTWQSVLNKPTTLAGYGIADEVSALIPYGDDITIINRTLPDGSRQLMLSGNIPDKEWITNQGYLTEHQSLANYYTKTDVDGIITPITDSISDLDIIRTNSLLATTAVQQVTFNSHTGNTVIHVSQDDRDRWNAKADTSDIKTYGLAVSGNDIQIVEGGTTPKITVPYAVNADKLANVESKYYLHNKGGYISSENIDRVVGFKMHDYATGGNNNFDAIERFGSVISIPASNSMDIDPLEKKNNWHWQLALSTSGNMFLRHVTNDGEWKPWHQIAFLDSTVAKASALATPITLWGIGDINAGSNITTAPNLYIGTTKVQATSAQQNVTGIGTLDMAGRLRIGDAMISYSGGILAFTDANGTPLHLTASGDMVAYAGKTVEDLNLTVGMLADVNVSNLANGQTLVWNGSKWTNKVIETGITSLEWSKIEGRPTNVGYFANDVGYVTSTEMDSAFGNVETYLNGNYKAGLADTYALVGHTHTQYSLTTHDHDGTYLGIGDKAADSAKLNGKSDSDFVHKNGNVITDADTFRYRLYVDGTQTFKEDGVDKVYNSLIFLQSYHGANYIKSMLLRDKSEGTAYADNNAPLTLCGDSVSSLPLIRMAATLTEATGKLAVNKWGYTGEADFYVNGASYLDGSTLLNGNLVFGNGKGTESIFPGHYYHNYYNSDNNVYFHAYPSPYMRTVNSQLHLRVGSSSNWGFRVFEIRGDGHVKWNGNIHGRAFNFDDIEGDQMWITRTNANGKFGSNRVVSLYSDNGLPALQLGWNVGIINWNSSSGCYEMNDGVRIGNAVFKYDQTNDVIRCNKSIVSDGDLVAFGGIGAVESPTLENLTVKRTLSVGSFFIEPDYRTNRLSLKSIDSDILLGGDGAVWSDNDLLPNGDTNYLLGSLDNRWSIVYADVGDFLSGIKIGGEGTAIKQIKIEPYSSYNRMYITALDANGSEHRYYITCYNA